MRSPRRSLLLCVLLVAAGVGAARAQAPAPFPDPEPLAVPTPARLMAIRAAAQREGWGPQSAAIRATALRAYEREKLPAAAAWFNVYRWSVLFGENEADFVVRWIQAVTAARVNHPGMANRYLMRQQPLGLWLSPECQGWLLGNRDFSEEFFSLVQPVDFLPGAFQILDQIHLTDPARFGTYANLALAIALVYDVPPPPDWPHAQVSDRILARKLPRPLDAFKWWTREDQLGHTYHRLARLGADELKFVVDAAAPLDELEWSQQISNYPLNLLERAYTIVSYRRDRAAANAGMWPEKSYSLPAILAAGGICVDQAYFATQAGKARGVPTLLFEGAGNDGRHAWFGFLDGDQKWRLDAGRYAEQRFVTGFARDPQTWRGITDHELRFLSERFRTLPSFRQSQTHALFAEDFLATGDAAAAAKAARKAVNYERRNQRAWEALLAAEVALGRDAKQREAALNEAVQAFQNYPDLEVFYSHRLSESLRARGQTSAADFEQRRVARKYQGDRTDLSVQQARDMLLRAIATQPLLEQVRAYNSAVDNFGRGAGMVFFDQVVRIFVEHLVQLGQRAEALRAAERARNTMKVENGSQLDREFANLLRALKR